MLQDVSQISLDFQKMTALVKHSIQTLESAPRAAGSRKVIYFMDQKFQLIPILTNLSAMQGAMVLFLFVAMNKLCKQVTMGMLLFMENKEPKIKLWVQFLPSWVQDCSYTHTCMHCACSISAPVYIHCACSISAHV